jgi:hypothetical protein
MATTMTTPDEYDLSSPDAICKSCVNRFIPDMGDPTSPHSKSLIVCISEGLPVNVMRQAFQVSNECNCCGNHKRNRPIAIDSPFNTEKVKSSDEPVPWCNCPCRYNARYLRRAYFFLYLHGFIPYGDEEMQLFYGEEADDANS